jgi:hypothetical protein
MINQLNKHVNHLNIKKNLYHIESIEHGHKITKKNLLSTEAKEHQLNKKPSMSKLLGIEKKEHANNGNIVIKKEY